MQFAEIKKEQQNKQINPKFGFGLV